MSESQIRVPAPIKLRQPIVTRDWAITCDPDRPELSFNSMTAFGPQCSRVGAEFSGLLQRAALMVTDLPNRMLPPRFRIDGKPWIRQPDSRRTP